MNKITTANYINGFTLLELAMVLFIVTLLLGGFLMPYASQIEARNRAEAQEQLDLIRQALIGFAIINGRLPCHTTESDPTSVNYGVEDPLPCNSSEATAGWDGDGILPWKTLGLDNALDPWGSHRSNNGDPWIGFIRYRVDQNFSSTFGLSTTTTDNLTVVDSIGNILISVSERPVAIIYSTGANTASNQHNASYEANPCGNVSGYDSDSNGDISCPDGWPLYQAGQVSGSFDDITVWLTRPLIFNRMVSAGVLP